MEKSDSNKIANLGVIGALMVVLIHVPKSAVGAATVFYKIMPDGFLGTAVMMFFAISGFLLAGHLDEKGWWLRENQKRWRTLLVPYLILNLFWFGVMLAYHAIGSSNGGLSEYAFSWRGLFAAIGIAPGESGGNPIVGPLWYVRCLLLTVLTLPVFMPIVRRGRTCAFGLCALLYAVHIAISGHGGFAFGSVYRLQGVAYFLLGIAFRLYGIPKASLKAGLLFLALGLTASATMVFGAGVPQRIANWSVKPLTFVAMWSLAPETPWPKLLTRNSFAIYSLHYFLVHPSWLICGHLGIHNQVFGNPLVYLMFPVVTFASIILFAETLRRHLPRVATIVLGGR